MKNKKIILLIMAMLCVHSIVADVDLDFALVTDEDIYANFYLEGEDVYANFYGIENGNK